MEKLNQEISQNIDHLENKFKLWFREVLAEQSQVSPKENDVITIEEAMKITHLARQTIYGLVFEKRIPFFKRPHSKKLFFSRTALLDWVQPKSNSKY